MPIEPPTGCILLDPNRLSLVGPSDTILAWVKARKWAKEKAPTLWTWPSERPGALVWGEPQVPGPTPIAIYACGSIGWSVAVAPRSLERPEDVAAAIEEGTYLFWDQNTRSIVHCDDEGFDKFLPAVKKEAKT
jgi:hypothetical protein